MRLALEDEGYGVVEAGSGEVALDRFAKAPPSEPIDLVIIDLMLPGIDGFECCREIRRESAVPIIMVTARTDTHDIVAGLEAGADDYVTKPFEPKELAARIRALMRRARSTEGGPPTLTFGELEVMPDAGVVRLAGEEVHLTRTEFLLLCELAANSGKVFEQRTAARTRLELRLFRRRTPRRRPHPPAPYQGRARPGKPPLRAHGSRPRLQARKLNVVRGAASPRRFPQGW